MQLSGDIEDAAVIERILDHIGRDPERVERGARQRQR